MKNLEYLITTVDANNYDYKNEDKLIKKSIESLNDGGKNQIIITIEELAELTQAILNIMTHDNKENRLNLAEEITDVFICLRYVNFIFDLDTRVTVSKEYKNLNVRDVVYDLSRLSQSLTKHLRNKTNIDDIFELYHTIINELKYLIKYYNIDKDLIIKIRKLKIERLRKVLEEGEKY